jgi:hypothetical protein
MDGVSVYFIDQWNGGLCPEIKYKLFHFCTKHHANFIQIPVGLRVATEGKNPEALPVILLVLSPVF